MAQLAIKGHATRGSEVIEILEMLGGHNKFNLNGNADEWYVLDTKIYRTNRLLYNEKAFTLEEFLEKFPYKIGDSVSSKYLKNYKIEKAEWESCNNRVIYKLQGMGWYSVEELQPYKEETMETITIDDFKANTKEWLIDKLESMSKDNALQAICNIHDELQKSKYTKTYKECCDVLGLNTKEETMEDKLIPRIDLAGYCKDKYIIDLGNYEIKQEKGKTYAVRKQPKYPKTIEECAKVLSTLPHTRNGVSGYSSHALWKFQQLLICRDAYWKIAGDWKYDANKTEEYFYIVNKYGRIVKEHYMNFNHILAFPTEEMRDTFYENFKDLIEECKEFL